MRIEQAFLDSVFFVCEELDDGGLTYRRPGGTGFKVGVPAEPGASFVYLVTARHCIEEAQGQTIWLRFNRSTGGVFDLETRREDWTLSLTDDVAAIRMDIPTLRRENVNERRVHLSSFVDADYRFRPDDMVGGLLFDRNAVKEIGQEGMPIQVGDDLFITGLFTQHTGTANNIPVARFGTIAAMPTEPVVMKRFGGTYFKALGYLIECMSWGGISGSPVFWTAPMVDFVTVNNVPFSVPAYKIALLGLLSGHFGIEQKANTTGDVILDHEGMITTELNAGIAIVTPASAIKDLLMTPEFAEERERLIEEARERRERRTAATADAAMGDPVFSRDDFMRDLTKVTRPVEPPDQGSSGTSA